MKYDATHILTSLKNDVKGTKPTSTDTKNENKRGKFIKDSWIWMLYLKKPMVKSVIYLLFSYQTGYIVTLYTLSDS